MQWAVSEKMYARVPPPGPEPITTYSYSSVELEVGVCPSASETSVAAGSRKLDSFDKEGILTLVIL